MSRSDQYDELEEMSVSPTLEDDISLGKQPKSPKGKPGQKPKTPYQIQKEEEQRRARTRMVLIIGIIFVAILGALIAVGLAFSPDTEETIEKSTIDASRGYFLNNNNLPDKDPAGVRGMVKEAYFTTEGNLAVTLNLSNGTNSEHEVVRVGATIVNGDGETVARQTLDSSHFQKKFYVPANGRSEMYFEIEEQYVVLPNDPLTAIGSTLEIGSVPTDGVMPVTTQTGAVVGSGPKDIAEGRSFYEKQDNLPEFSADGIKASIVRARYTNDGSLVIDFSLSNGTDNDHSLASIDLKLQNGEGSVITDYVFGGLTQTIPAKSYETVQLIVDAAHVMIQNDPLSTITTTISVSSNAIVAVTPDTTASEPTETSAAA